MWLLYINKRTIFQRSKVTVSFLCGLTVNFSFPNFVNFYHYFPFIVARSPVFSHLSASLQGLCTIRAFNAETIFTREFDSHQDLHTEGWFLFLACSRWFSMRIDFLCACFTTAVAFSCVLAEDSKFNTFCTYSYSYSGSIFLYILILTLDICQKSSREESEMSHMALKG